MGQSRLEGASGQREVLATSTRARYGRPVNDLTVNARVEGLWSIRTMRQLGVTALLVWIAAGGTLVGCKDQQKCDEALATARKALQDEYLDLALARQWREHAGKLCGAGATLQSLDQDIVGKEAALAKEVQEKAAAEAEAGQKAIEAAQKIWKQYDALETKQRDKDALKKHDKKARGVVKGLTPEYAKQVTDYNKKQFKKRLEGLGG